jgi:UDP-N-acetylglucosamine diphosphorylase/glucosamine-1-phosphate N-acetyltransferase
MPMRPARLAAEIKPMTQPHLAIFDDGLGRWGPLTRCRPIFDQRSARLTLAQRIERATGLSAEAFSVPHALAAVAAAHWPERAINTPLNGGQWLLVNGRWDALSEVERVNTLELNHALVDQAGGVLAARLTADQANAWLQAGPTDPPSNATTTELPPTLLTRPWQLLNQLPAALAADLAAPGLGSVDDHALRQVIVFGDYPLHLSQRARIDPGAVLNCEQGPIAIDAGAHIQPRALLEGPCTIGANTTIAAHGYIRSNTAIGPNCKVGGEVAGSIIQGDSNKAHDGYLGHAMVGRWANLGAATVVSNLKNTYGPVRVQLDRDQPPEDTARQRVGPIIGDFVRTAIGTRLMTGSVIDVGCMLALSGFAPKLAPPLGFYTDQGRAEYDVDKLIETIEAMMARRNTTLDEATEKLIRQLA